MKPLISASVLSGLRGAGLAAVFAVVVVFEAVGLVVAAGLMVVDESVFLVDSVCADSVAGVSSGC